jgi:hypothetical protein
MSDRGNKMPQFMERLFYTTSWQTMHDIVALTPGLTAPRLYHLTVDEYHRMIEAEVFPPKARIELIEGVLYEMPPMFRPHQVGIMYLTRAFGALAPQGRLLVQLPFILSNASEPEPDLGILAAVFPREGGTFVYPRGQGTHLIPRHAEEVTLEVDDLFAAIGNT